MGHIGAVRRQLPWQSMPRLCAIVALIIVPRVSVLRYTHHSFTHSLTFPNEGRNTHFVIG